MTCKLIAPTPTPYSEYCESFDDFDDYIALPSAQEVGSLQLEEIISDSTIRQRGLKRFSLKSQVDKVVGSRTPGFCDHGGLSFQERSQLHIPADDDFCEAKNERRYRYLLEHDFNPTCEFDAAPACKFDC